MLALCQFSFKLLHMSHEIPNAGSLLRSPSSAHLNHLETETVFALDEASYYYDRQTAGPTDEYMKQRRLFIGPVADITHPEFGRPNLPSETYAIFYRVREIPRMVQITTEDGDKIYEPMHSHQITEYVVDHNHNLIDTQIV